MTITSILLLPYNALTDSIEIVNHSAGNHGGLTAIATIYDINGKRAYQKKTRLNSNEDTTIAWMKLSRLMPNAPSDVYFLSLTLADKKTIISENTYVMGKQEGCYQALQALPKAEVTQQMSVSSNGNDYTASITLHNKSKVPAPFLRLNLKGGDGEQILPVVYSDNYITLMPGEQKTVTIQWRKEDARGQLPNIEVTGIY